LSGGKVVAGSTITISTFVGEKFQKAHGDGEFGISQISIIDTSSNSVIYTS
jgi:hypothetical protein